MRRSTTLAMLMLMAAALAGGVGAPSRAAAQDQSQFAIDIHAGYEGAYRLGEWFPVTIDIGNDGADVRGVLEWSFPGQQGEQAFRRAIDLPRGSHKRVTIEVLARGFARNGQVRLLDDETPLASQDVALDAIDDSRFLIGVVSSDPALLNSLNSMQVGSFSSALVRHLAIGELPEQAVGLRGLNALFVHDTDTGALNPAQRSALALWVSTGGQLIVSGGVSGEKTAAGLAELLPADVGGGIGQGDLAPLASLANVQVRPQNASAPLNQAQPRAEAEVLPQGTALLFRSKYGAGQVTFSAFDLASLRGWTGEPSLWGELLAWVSPSAVSGARLNQINLLQNVLRLPSLGLPSATTVLLFLLTYVLLIGPINYLVLRRMRRLEWAWLTVPLIVLVFAAGLYLVGFGLRGGTAQLNQVAIVQGVEAQPDALATSFVGLFSPQRASYTVGFPADTLVSELHGWNDGGGQSSPVLTGDAGAPSLDVLVDVASVRTFVAEAAVPLLVSVRSDLQLAGDQLSGEIRNDGASALEDALLVQGDRFVRLGSLAPGAVQRVESNDIRQGFPFGVSLSESGLFNRQQMLITVFNNDIVRLRNSNAPGAGVGPSGVYLLAWINQPAVGASINGRESSQNGLTMYIIRLRSG